MEENKDLITSLIKFQASLKTVAFDKQNPHFRNKYATLTSIWESIKKPLTDNNLAVTQTLSDFEGDVILTTVLLHSSGQSISSKMKLLLVKNDMQSMGSALTYARRYSISALLGIVSDEDDDGNEASEAPKKPVRKAVATSQEAQSKAAAVPSSDLGNYMIKLGKNKGKTLSQVDSDTLLHLHDYLDKADERNAAGEELMLVLRKYLKLPEPLNTEEVLN